MDARRQEAADEEPLAGPCKRAIRYSLDCLLHDQAVFFAERLVAESPGCGEARLLLATSYLRAGDAARAGALLQEASFSHADPQLQYMSALCSLQLGRPEEAEAALLCGPQEVTGPRDVPGGPPGLYLLGLAKERLQMPEQAMECYSKCLELCPFMWSAYERLSQLTLGAPGAYAPGLAQELFGVERLLRDRVLHPTAPDGGRVAGDCWRNAATGTPTADDVDDAPSAKKPRRGEAPSPCMSSLLARLSPRRWLGGGAPSPMAARCSPPSPRGGDMSVEAAPRRSFPASPGGGDMSVEAAPSTKSPLTVRASPPRRRGSPLGLPRAPLPHKTPGSGSLRVWPPWASPAAEVGGRLASAVRCSLEAQFVGAQEALLEEPSLAPSPTPQRASDPACASSALPRCSSQAPGSSAGSALSRLLVTLGEAVHAFSGFACREAISALRSLSPRQMRGAFVLDLLARCYFEMAEYSKAVEIWQECCERDRCLRTVSLELYSTALWHLRDAAKLGALAQRAMALDRERSQTWCVVGNCYSLRDDHEQAIRAFNRAIQLGPSCAYAHTLLAHEYVASEKFDSAVQMYERAIAIDGRHYNAWWGLGNLYHRRQDHNNARYHLEKALSINGGNPVVRTSLGMVYEALKQPGRALQLFASAESSPHCRTMATFHKGSLLSALGRHEAAVEVLRRTAAMAPKEASVHFQLGRALVACGDRKQALLHFTRSMELCSGKDAKDYQLIVAAQLELTRSSVLDAAVAVGAAAAGTAAASAGPKCCT